MKTARAWTKWLLFVAFICLVPCVHVAPVVGGLLPLLFLVLVAFSSLGWFFVNTLNVLVSGALLYGLAAGLTWTVFRIPSTPVRLVVVAGILASLLVAASHPIYGSGHNGIDWYHWMDLMRRIPLYYRY